MELTSGKWCKMFTNCPYFNQDILWKLSSEAILVRSPNVFLGSRRDVYMGCRTQRIDELFKIAIGLQRFFLCGYTHMILYGSFKINLNRIWAHCNYWLIRIICISTVCSNTPSCTKTGLPIVFVGPPTLQPCSKRIQLTFDKSMGISPRVTVTGFHHGAYNVHDISYISDMVWYSNNG